MLERAEIFYFDGEILKTIKLELNKINNCLVNIMQDG